ncbi:guanine nucleotide-binding protein G(I)/G(S)/G(O) subunit gamma-T2 isoform X1 [Lynx canadensis]|uniref:guanine nucleotide-binding protein G(I)/G(S)/G(O) subunit gamma-T2 isoform X1 n=1 Tax=Lynx canadensis TaxID=61383 RepID=UPI0011AFFAF6|nr:guanine nucleotide-binding protein G(I)/G(S)/G(O) subunit gamma-T2 isoform X1 [Lynx canadensis]
METSRAGGRRVLSNSGTQPAREESAQTPGRHSQRPPEKRSQASEGLCVRETWGPCPVPDGGVPGGRMAQELSEKDLLKMNVEQLKKEVKNTRVPISKTGKEIKDFVEAEAGNDPLLKGVPEDKNPFKEKGGCVIS